MKVYIGKHPQSYTTLSKIKNPHSWFTRVIKWLSHDGQGYPSKLQMYLDHYHLNRKRKVKITVHDYDLWNADTTLSLVISEILKAYRIKTNNHCPLAPLKNSPPEVTTTSNRLQEEWDYALDEMIWTFTAISEGNAYGKEKKERAQNGLRLFAKHFNNLWS